MINFVSRGFSYSMDDKVTYQNLTNPLAYLSLNLAFAELT